MRLTMIVLALLITVSAYASPEKRNGFLIKSDLNYSYGDKQVKKSQEFIMDDSLNSWTTLTDLKGGVLLLGKRVKADKETIHMEFIVVDTNKTPNGVLSTPSIIARLGEPAHITIEGNRENKKEKIAFTLTATRTEYNSSTTK